uniref:Catenin delta-2-like isoform X2 n=1 Tax=Dermatophagoides pteronyssinus TaxID=6956 RepID=A0A6P6Y2V2_DERPT|nr:catenin delta-2-like isoform X2 [Dermatophagoides pteronyssinus]
MFYPFSLVLGRTYRYSDDDDILDIKNLKHHVIYEDDHPKLKCSTSQQEFQTTTKRIMSTTTTSKTMATDSNNLDGQQQQQQQQNSSSTKNDQENLSSSNNDNNRNDDGIQNDQQQNPTTTTLASTAATSSTTNNGILNDVPENAQLLSRTTQQVKTQQVKTITKVYTTREIRHIGPDGQPIESNNNSNSQVIAATTSVSPGINIDNNNENNNDSSTNEYSNFPGPKMINNGQDHHHHVVNNQSQQQQQQSNNNNNNFDYNNQNIYDPHYSNTNFQKLLQQQQQQQQQQHHHHQMASSPSPGSVSTGTTGSTAAAPFVVNTRAIYDPYARNNQIGYQDYSNFSNYQDLTSHHENQNGPMNVDHTSASPQPPIRRHIAEMAAGPPPGAVYGYVPAGANHNSTIQIPINAAAGGPPQGVMHSPSAAIYGNFGAEDAPQGYLDRRQTYDDTTGPPPGSVTYGQMMDPTRGQMPPMTAAMYEDAESAYQHLHALQQAGIAMDPQQAAVFFQNGATVLSSGAPGGPGGPPRIGPMPGGGGVAPGSSAVTAIGPDGVRWRDPDLHEVIEFLTHPNSIVRANAAAYLQHLCFMDDSMKAKTRALGGIPALINLLAQDVPEIQRNACGALRNLSYGRQNDENKRAFRAAGGIPNLVRLLRKTPDNEIRELVTSVLWNLSSCEDLKRQIIDDALQVLVSTVIIPHSGWDRNNPQQQPSQVQQHQQPIYWSTVFRNASGVVRNVSSAGEYARRRLRECEGLVDSLLFLVRAAIGKNDMDNKSVENCVCILRNLSYRCQEVVDPDYDKHPPNANNISNTSYSSPSSQQTSTASPSSSTLSPSSSSSSKNSTSSLMGGISSKVGENISCFGGSKKNKSKNSSHTMSPSVSASGLESKTANLTLNSNGPRSGMELLWQTDVVQPYLALLSECSNPETLEAAAGAIQNLAACYWQPSIDIRGAVRKEKGLPILVELLRMEVDRVVCAVATALRNLAMDTRNKELIGKYALKDLVSKLPAPSATGIPLETGTSDDTVAAVLATLNEVISRNPDFAKSMLEAGGMQRLTLITKHRNRFSSRVVKFTCQLLYNMWQHTELRDVYRKAGWKESHFIISQHTTAANQSSRTSTRSVNGPSGNQQQMMMTPSQSAMMIPSTPTTNGALPGSGFYHSISANNTLSRPMSTVGGTKYEDHGHYRGVDGTGTLSRSGQHQQQQMMSQRMHEEMLMSDMIDGRAVANGTQTLVRAPIGGVPIFPPGTLQATMMVATSGASLPVSSTSGMVTVTSSSMVNRESQAITSTAQNDK